MTHIHFIDSHQDAWSRAAHSHAQAPGAEHGAHGARSRRTLDRAATPYALLVGGGDHSPASLPRGERERAREGNPSRPGADGALDRHAKNVSAPRDWRAFRYALRYQAGAIMGGRQAACGALPLLSVVSVLNRGGRHRLGGLETCGSVWTCPVCAMKISAARCLELQAAIQGHQAQGGIVLMLTLTIPHDRFDCPKALLDAVRGTWRKVKQGRAWINARDGFGWFGDVRALEVTHGGNGWHPHLHVLLFLKPGCDRQDGEKLAEWIFERWQDRVLKAGFGLCRRSAFLVEEVDNAAKVGEYLGLWGAAHELTLADHKRGKGGRTPWQILRDCLEKGRASDVALFRAYGESFKGARQLTWSRGLRGRYMPQPEPTDHDLAAEDISADDMARMRLLGLAKPLWRVIHARRLPAQVLKQADAGGVAAVRALLDQHGIAHDVVDWVGAAPILDLRQSAKPAHAIRSTAIKAAAASPAAVACGQP